MSFKGIPDNLLGDYKDVKLLEWENTTFVRNTVWAWAHDLWKNALNSRRQNSKGNTKIIKQLCDQKFFNTLRQKKSERDWRGQNYTESGVWGIHIHDTHQHCVCAGASGQIINSRVRQNLLCLNVWAVWNAVRLNTNMTFWSRSERKWAMKDVSPHTERQRRDRGVWFVVFDKSFKSKK